MQTYSRGELYFANLNPVIGSEQAGYRPVLIIQNNVGNRYSPTVIVAPLTSRPDAKPTLPTHCYIRAGDALKLPSLVLLEQLRTIDKNRLDSYIGSLGATYMKSIDYALAISVGLKHYALDQRSDTLCNINTIHENQK
ncbi:MAG: type II toxin-antitoxin system PemK/MazF family toxin [Lachnospiraceae bacterium]|nr:type II toxin-antitoxin system PemK/MazF family toxin [Lachnospiraceae bacterium]